MTRTTPCALCGTTQARRVQGRAGCACVDCIGEAAKQAIAKSAVVQTPTLTASDRCLLCGDTVTKGQIAAAHPPYVLCHECLMAALEGANEVGESAFTQVNF